jgi:iron complex outermembrane receptor protein
MWEAEIIDRPDIPEQEGSRLANSPVHSGSLWTKYTFREGRMDGFAVGLGARYKGSFWLKEQYTRFDANGIFTGERNQIEADDSLIFDAMLEYKTTIRGRDTRFSINVQNLLDERYYATGVPLNSALVPGDALKVFFSIEFRI